MVTICKIVLSKYDFTTATLTKCDNILNDIESLQPDLILADLGIPGIGGEKAIGIVKQHEETKNIPVLIFSANTNIQHITEKAQADGYIEKPFALNTFIETIQSHLR